MLGCTRGSERISTGWVLAWPGQEDDCHKLADVRGWSVSKLYQDNDVSVLKEKVVRPEFERLLSDLGARLIDVRVGR